MDESTYYPNDDDSRHHAPFASDTIGPPTIITAPKAATRALNNLLLSLKRMYTIDKAALIIYDENIDRMCVTHFMSRGVMKSGLALTIPNQSSLLYQILRQGFPVADNCPQLMSDNIIERKILLSPGARSVVIIPLIDNFRRLGLISLTSPIDSAFSVYIDGVGEDHVADFAHELRLMVQPSEVPA